MPGCVRFFKYSGLWLSILFSSCLAASGFGARVESVTVREEPPSYIVNVRFEYLLSPTAKEAIYKGVPLSWLFIVKAQKSRLFWNETVVEKRIPFVIQYQALLNQYSVRNLSNEQVERFASLNAALRYMATIRELELPEIGQLSKHDQLAVKMQFDREFLPIPLRPESYFDPQWSLSSDWFIWHPQK